MEAGNAAAPEGLSERLLASDTSQDDRRRAHANSDADSPRRLASLDITRGVTIAFMLFVNHCGSSPWWLPHAAWDGVHVADFVMPGFLVIVGASITLSTSSQRGRGATAVDIFKKTTSRSIKLFLMGLFIQGGVATGGFPQYDLASLRIMGVLQRIAICYFVMSLLALAILPGAKSPERSSHQFLENPADQQDPSRPLKLMSRTQVQLWGLAIGILVAYTSLCLTLRVPECRRPALTTACNAASWIDGKILRPQHLYPYPTCSAADPPCAHFDPEGLFTTLGGAMSSTAFGFSIGFVFTAPSTSRVRIQTSSTISGLCILAGIALHFLGLPLNKNLYSGSFVLLTTGVTTSILAAVYWLVDVRSSRTAKTLLEPFVWLGTNPIAVFFGDEVLEMSFPLVFWRRPENNLRDWLWSVVVRRIFGPNTAGWLVGALIDVLFWTAIAGELYRRRIFFKV